MQFLIEENDFIYVTLDTLIARKAIDNSDDHSYKYIKMEDFFVDKRLLANPYPATHFPPDYRTSVPIGTVEFVQQFYRTFYGIERENSIEIPLELRKERYLKRDYHIDVISNLPEEGEFFYKDATDERTLSLVGTRSQLEQEIVTNHNNEVLSHLFVCSELLNVISEVRFYIIRGELKQLSYYKGACGIEFDHEIVKEIIEYLNNDGRVPRSYSFDVMITDRGTALLEVHTYSGLGIHNYMFDVSILNGYIDSDEYYRNGNYPVEKDCFTRLN